MNVSGSNRLNKAAVLAALANGIIPPDARDDGAASVGAGARLAGKADLGINQTLYAEGIETAQRIAQRDFQRTIEELSPAEIHELLNELHEKHTAFFKQLRMDVAALYLSEP